MGTCEQFNTVKNLDNGLVIIYHWAECHGVDNECTDFKLKVVVMYSNALSKHIDEAHWGHIEHEDHS